MEGGGRVEDEGRKGKIHLRQTRAGAGGGGELQGKK